jgi:anthranilate phosphoribosyltransferase
MSMLQSANVRIAQFERLFSPGLELKEQVELLKSLSEGELSASELTACAGFLRAQMSTVFLGEPAIDIVRSGGGAYRTFNIAITAAFIAAGSGIRVAKHCIRSLDHDEGIVSVLKALKLNLVQNPKEAAIQVKQCGMTFLVAEVFHPLLLRVKTAQQQLTREGGATFLNKVLPLCNPAEVRRMALGVSDKNSMSAYIDAMRHLDYQEAYVFSSQNIDAVTNVAKTHYHYFDKSLAQESVWPKTLMGMQSAEPKALVVEGVEAKAATIEAILANDDVSAKRDVALMNAAVAISLGYPERLSFVEALGMAQEALESGAALACLRSLQR